MRGYFKIRHRCPQGPPREIWNLHQYATAIMVLKQRKSELRKWTNKPLCGAGCRIVWRTLTREAVEA